MKTYMDVKNNKPCILMMTLSNHTSFQDGVFSMYENLKNRYNVYTLTLKDSDYTVSHDSNNIFVDAPLRPGITKKAFNIPALHQMMKEIKRIPIDYVYFESSHIWNYPVVLYCKRKGITIAHTINDVIPHEGDAHRGINDRLNELSASFSDYVVMRSADGLMKAKTRFPRYTNKMRKVDIWYSFPEYRKPQSRKVLFFGRMNRYKGIDKLYDLIAATPEIQYVVAGKADGSVMKQVDAIKLLPNAVVYEERIPYYQMHDFFFDACCVVLPYETATQSGVIVDAYKHSRPAIAFNVGAIGEEILNGITGYVVTPGSIDELVNRVREVVNMDNNQIEKMCKEAYQFGIIHYSAHSREKEFLSAIGVK